MNRSARLGIACGAIGATFGLTAFYARQFSLYSAGRLGTGAVRSDLALGILVSTFVLAAVVTLIVDSARRRGR